MNSIPYLFHFLNETGAYLHPHMFSDFDWIYLFGLEDLFLIFNAFIVFKVK